MLSLVVEHWDSGSELEELLAQASVRSDEDIFGDIDNSLVDARSVSVVSRQRKREITASGETFDGTFESRKHSTCAENEFQWARRVALLYKWPIVAVGMELVCKGYESVLADIHLFISLFYEVDVAINVVHHYRIAIGV